MSNTQPKEAVAVVSPLPPVHLHQLVNPSIRIKTIQLKDGQWAVSMGAGKYYTSTKSSTQKDAIIKGLKNRALDYQDKMDLIHSQLEKLGAIDSQDPHGYLA